MFGDGRVREIQIARSTRSARAARRAAGRSASAQRCPVTIFIGLTRVHRGQVRSIQGSIVFGITAKRDGNNCGNGSVVRSIPTVNGSDRRVSGGPEGALSPKWAKPPHIQEHSTGGQESEKYKVLWAPTPAPSPTDARTCSRIAPNGLRYDVGCGP